MGVREHKIGQVDMKNGNLLVIEVGMWYLACFMLVVNDLLSAEYMSREQVNTSKLTFRDD